MSQREIVMSNKIIKYLEENCPEALLFPDHDEALIGTAKIFREEQFVEVAMYSYDALIQSFTERFRGDESEDPEQDAIEWVDYNVVGAYMGIYTPFIVYN